MRKQFTGKHMFLVLFIGFGIVMAVNFTMAALAARSFSGTVVENSYVASQDYNDWLAEAEKQKALGWSASVSRGGNGRLVVATQGVPDGAIVEAELRRPVGQHENASLAFERASDTDFVSNNEVAGGRWIVRLKITHGDDTWASEEPLA